MELLRSMQATTCSCHAIPINSDIVPDWLTNNHRQTLITLRFDWRAQIYSTSSVLRQRRRPTLRRVLVRFEKPVKISCFGRFAVISKCHEICCIYFVLPVLWKVFFVIVHTCFGHVPYQIYQMPRRKRGIRHLLLEVLLLCLSLRLSLEGKKILSYNRFVNIKSVKPLNTPLFVKMALIERIRIHMNTDLCVSEDN